MDLKEKASYILGLIEGAKLDVDKEENKILKNISELLQCMAGKLDEVERACDENSVLVDELCEDFSNMGRGRNKKRDRICGGGCDCEEGCKGEDFEGEGGYEVTCPNPNCKRVIELDDKIFEKDDIVCPDCGEKIDFDFKEEEEQY